MRPNLRLYSNASQRFRNTLRSAASLRAMIHRTEYGLLIELSDGRMCTLSHDAFGPTTNAMNAAMQWARRKGATSVEICD